jgi:yecA family protein
MAAYLREVSMTETSFPPLGFDELADLLLPLGTINSPSELHGLLCGKLCAGAQLSETSWLLEAAEFLDFTQAPDERVRDALSRLYHQSREQLDQDFSPLLMLPDDDTAMEERVSALSQWCHGFLSGFGGVSREEALSEEALAMLEDLAAIVNISADEDDEDEEADYMEVVEYVRVLAAALYEETPKPPRLEERPGNATLH